MVVAAHHHHSEVSSQLRGLPIGKLSLQPTNCDTAAGIFLPLAYLRARDPNAIVVILPSDHFIYPEHPFLETVRQAMASADAMPACMLLLGVQPDGLETDYGWIQRGLPVHGSPDYPVYAVSSFLEKPGAAQADAALRTGGLWNTLVITATVESLWQAGCTCFPDMMPLFERVMPAWDTPTGASRNGLPTQSAVSARLLRFPCTASTDPLARARMRRRLRRCWHPRDEAESNDQSVPVLAAIIDLLQSQPDLPLHLTSRHDRPVGIV
jgi:hypothetical protein